MRDQEREPADRKREIGLAVAEIAAQGDGDRYRTLLHPAGAEDNPGMVVDRQ